MAKNVFGTCVYSNAVKITQGGIHDVNEYGYGENDRVKGFVPCVPETFLDKNQHSVN
jgi:hypothetical protein